MSDFKDRKSIEKLRKSKGMEKSELAKELGLSRTSYYDLISGKTKKISAEILAKLTAIADSNGKEKTGALKLEKNVKITTTGDLVISSFELVNLQLQKPILDAINQFYTLSKGTFDDAEQNKPAL
ncbi:MAG TPA: helix-turn-helix transcriptional regulator [Cyclobacteriaceae bacterium]|jgi:transcriptional regulator with XRE-family HTH domain|nr:helix-turn-helix transcriptional regulator [Cyclobacteriaceae bacterium]